MASSLPPDIVKQTTRPVVRLFRSRAGLWVIGGISFVESALLVPIMTDPFLVAYILVNRAKAAWAIIVTTLTSVAGGAASYYMAYYFSDVVLGYLAPETIAYFETLTMQMQAETFVLTILGAVTPIPYTLVGLAAGFVKGNIWVFIGASLLGRGFRYAVVGYLTYRFGEHAAEHIKKNLRLATIGTFVLVAAYIWYKFF